MASSVSAPTAELTRGLSAALPHRPSRGSQQHHHHQLRMPLPSLAPCRVASADAARSSPVSRTALRVAAGAGPGVTSEAAAAKAAEPVALLDVVVESEVGQSYELLQQRLARGEWEEADAETRRLLCVLAGDGAAKRKWVYFTEVQNIPHKDLLTLDRLWRAYSDDRFGYSVQRRIWKALDRRWKPFFLKIEWTFGENSTYKKFPMDFSWASDAPKGHLPLTNCLRGTQLFEGLLTHPAFAQFDDEQVMPEDSALPDYSKVGAEEGSASSPSNGTPTAPSKPPTGLTGSIFDEDFNSADYGF